MKINEIIAEDVECTPGAIHVPFSDLINNPKKYPGIVFKPNTSTYDSQSDPDYYNILDTFSCVPPRDPAQQRGWWRHPYLSPKSWKWESPKNQSKAFRANEKGKGLEPIATKFNLSIFTGLLKAYRKGVELKLIQPLSPEEITALLLTEGRSDFGFNEADLSVPAVRRVANIAMRAGLIDTDANFVAVIYEKQQTAQRLGIPFYQAWQGGRTHLDRFNKNLAAATNPKNSQLVAQIKQAMGYVAPAPQELNTQLTIVNQEPVQPTLSQD
jgi:hypothetical protein